MKVKILTLVTALLCGQIMVYAQTPTFQKGDKVLNLGLGFGGYAPSGYKVTTPSASASFEVGIKDNDSKKGSIGIGGYLGYASYKENNTGTTNPTATYGYASYFETASSAGNNYWSVNRIMIGARGAYHFTLIDKLDTYGGITLGFIARSWKWNGSVSRTDHPSKKPFSGDLFLGGRYYLSDKFAVIGELGLGAYLTVGISLKI
jgi:hypothetical protein